MHKLDRHAVELKRVPAQVVVVPSGAHQDKVSKCRG